MLLSICSAQTAKDRGKSTNTCVNFRTGTFYSIIPGNGYCVRNDSVARMYMYNDTTLFYEYSIIWTSDCEMQMKFIKSNDSKSKSRDGDVLFVNLKPIDPTTYLYEMKLVNKQYPEGYNYRMGSSSTEKLKSFLKKK